MESRPVAATFLWLDLTRACNLACGHCYNSSGPHGQHGGMQREDWLNVLDQAAVAGVRQVQLIGGEPTMHPDFAVLVEHALGVGLLVEVFSNLTHIKPEWWELFQRDGVSLATSYYSDDAEEHNAVTGRPSHHKTRENVARATELGIALRTGVIHVLPQQRVAEAQTDLVSLGVESIGTDRVRHFGRGQGDHAACDVNELCGRCGDGVAAIGPDGDVSPCIMSTWMTAGNVRVSPLSAILQGSEMADFTSRIPRRAADPCDPGAECRPDAYPCYPKNG
ncbi:MAG TPA: radical SAM protein [Actinospica sp.]|nr:radical SAM protein [Actinospica sp.]